MEVDLEKLPTFSITQLRRQRKRVWEAATRSPVAITRRGKPAFVLMSVEVLQDLVGRRLGG